MANSPPSARSVEKVCRIGLRSARPLVSISTRPKCGILPRSRSATSRRSAFCKSVRVLQHRQPLPSSVTSSLLSRSSASSMPSDAELVDDQRGAFAFRRLQEAPHQRRLPGAEKAGDDRHRQPRSALALLPPAELAGGLRGEQIEDGVGHAQHSIATTSAQKRCRGRAAARSAAAQTRTQLSQETWVPDQRSTLRGESRPGTSLDQKSISRQYSPPMWRSTQ